MRNLEFNVARIEGAAADGRVCKDEIRVGDTFTRLYDHDFAMSGSEVERSELIPRGMVDLKVVKLEAYGSDLDVISSGMTCRMFLEGNFSSLEAGLVLGGKGVLESSPARGAR